MPKARAHPDQWAFDFEVPRPARGEAALAGLEKRVAVTVGSILASDPRSRDEIAGAMSALLGEEVSRAMLDAYASPARDGHRISVSRMIALVVVTERQDLFDPLMREGGMGVLVGEEVHTARLGHLDRQIAQLQAERKQIAGSAPLIRMGGMDGIARTR
jgi:hypothetical protein